MLPASLVKAGEITVQRLSTNVSGKARYSRIGQREFVPYRKDGLTFEVIKPAFQDYYASKMDADQVIDIIETIGTMVFSILAEFLVTILRCVVEYFVV